MKDSNPLTRRRFLRDAATMSAVAVGFPYVVPSSALGLAGNTAPSNRVAVGCIGVGPRGNGVLSGFLGDARAEVVAVCDVNRLRCEDTKKRIDGLYENADCAIYGDFRELLARDDIDAVSIATTDHWHVLHSLYAARAGKDMYVEKPLSLSVDELRTLRETIQAYGNVFQFGTQQRSSREFRFACELVRSGRIGELKHMKVGAPASIEQPLDPPAQVPGWLDYEMWLGSAPWAPYTEHRVQNAYWWHNSDYALGFVAGWGIHHVDIAQWGNAADDTGPVHIEGTGVFPKEGACDCATSWDIACVYPNGVTMSFTDNQKNQQGVVFEGTEGWVYVRRGFIDANPKSLLRSPIGPTEERLYESTNHVGNFVDCVQSRAKTICPIETAVRSDTVCHLSDIAMRVGRPLTWDPVSERFVAGDESSVADDGANRLLKRAMRSPWRL